MLHIKQRVNTTLKLLLIFKILLVASVQPN